MLDEFSAVTGYHRKHAVRLLGENEGRCPASHPARSRIYDEGVRQALVVLWEASDRVCGKRLKPLLPILVSALERHGHLQLEGEVRQRLLGASSATLDRLLRPTRDAVRGRKVRTRALPAVRRNVPVRTFADWGEPLPGFMEIDLVAHCGERVRGSFLHTVTLTDIASGWTECGVLLVREGRLVVESLARLRNLLPFPLRGIDSDNGSEFMNESLLEYCQTQGIAFTR
ncbi:MAG: transposase, partial [Myxococcota bacterium]|nr:transposase [Myxococcota bacterium]